MAANDDFAARRAGRAMGAVLRALRSTLVIAAVALTLFAVREGGVRWDELKRVAIGHSGLWAMVFAGVLIWDVLFRRGSRDHQRRSD